MAEIDDSAFDRLSARLTDPATPMPKTTNVLTGEAAAAAGRAFLVSEYGSEEALAVALRAAGRPAPGTAQEGELNPPHAPPGDRPAVEE